MNHTKFIGRLSFILYCVFYTATFAQERKIAITIDDLPATGSTSVFFDHITNKITTELKIRNIVATGFVNEGKLYTNGIIDSSKVAFLKKWISSGQDLGNHTYSHVYINSTPLEAYQEDVIKGEKVTRPLLEQYGKKLMYFRHTQLRTGPTEQYRLGLNSFLSKRGYITAPVTIDNDEYIYAYCYDQAKIKKDTQLLSKIGTDYLAYMERIFEYYEELSKSFLGYELPQILLIHANNLNADYLDQLLNILKKRKYSFVTLDEALKDKAYTLPEGTHQRGLSWIHRWMLTAGKEVSNQPEVSPFIAEVYSTYR